MSPSLRWIALMCFHWGVQQHFWTAFLLRNWLGTVLGMQKVPIFVGVVLSRPTCRGQLGWRSYLLAHVSQRPEDRGRFRSNDLGAGGCEMGRVGELPGADDWDGSTFGQVNHHSSRTQLLEAGNKNRKSTVVSHVFRICVCCIILVLSWVFSKHCWFWVVFCFQVLLA